MIQSLMLVKEGMNEKRGRELKRIRKLDPTQDCEEKKSNIVSLGL